MTSRSDYIVGIIGGGPAGAAMGAYLAKAGLRCVVLEREHFPRPHVGESLVPSSTRIFKELGFLHQMEEHRFPHKFGAVWSSNNSKKLYDHTWEGLNACDVDISFSERQQPGVEQDYTYHVDRGKFDRLLLEHAGRLGASIHEGARVQRVDFSDSQPVIHYRVGDRETRARVEMVVDASGRQTVLGNQLNLKVKDPVFDQFALHTWFEGYDRGRVFQRQIHQNYIYIHFLPISDTWLWQIPISDSITSIGVVTRKKHFKQAGEDREGFFWQCLSNHPNMYQGLRASRRMRPLKAEGDYSYSMSQLCGDRFVLIGDAARFVDPIFSSGVSVALQSAKFASRDILLAAEAGDFRRNRLQAYETTLRRGIDNWYEFISLYYRLNVLFTAFVKDPRYRLDVLRLLQGDVYDEQRPEVLLKMREVVSEVEQKKQHPWHTLLGETGSPRRHG